MIQTFFFFLVHCLPSVCLLLACLIFMLTLLGKFTAWLEQKLGSLLNNVLRFNGILLATFEYRMLLSLKSTTAAVNFFVGYKLKFIPGNNTENRALGRLQGTGLRVNRALVRYRVTWTHFCVGELKTVDFKTAFSLLVLYSSVLLFCHWRIKLQLKHH